MCMCVLRVYVCFVCVCVCKCVCVYGFGRVAVCVGGLVVDSLSVYVYVSVCEVVLGLCVYKHTLMIYCLD